jgi:hypothetical protein
MSVNLTMQRLTCIQYPMALWIQIHPEKVLDSFISQILQGYLDPSRYNQEMTSIPCLNGLVLSGHRKRTPWDFPMKYHEIIWNMGASQRFKIFRNQLTQQKSRMVRAPEIHPTGPRHPTPWHTSIDRRERPLSLWTSGRSQRPPSNLGNIR